MQSNLVKRGKRMNILLSAYSINPYKGSENAVGWNWVLTLSQKLPNSTIYILTRTYNEDDTRKGIEEFGLKNVKLIIVEVPKALDWFREKHSAFHHAYYILWQKVAYNWAKSSGIKFDVIHHISMGNYRITGQMYKIKDAYTIFGPVGGGQTTAPALRSYYNSNKLYENFRNSVNKAFSKFNFYKKQINAFDKVYAVNDETKNAIETAAHINCEKLCDIAISKDMQNLDIHHENKDEVEIIYLGRIIELKGKVDYTEIADIYKNADAFVHPTLRDSSGAVFVEAMANKLPIVALKQSISRDLDKHKCGIFVNVNQSKEEIINEFANDLAKIIENYDLRVELGQNGYDYANSVLTMDYKFDKIYGNLIKREKNEGINC